MLAMRCKTSPALHARRRGFTLIELMIVLVVAAILGAIALPSYQSSVRKARRADAMDAAVGVLQAQESYRANNPSYSSSLASLKPVQAATSTGGYYGAALSGVSGAGYTLTLSAVTGKSQASDSGCTSLVVAVTNGSPIYTPTGCWSK